MATAIRLNLSIIRTKPYFVFKCPLINPTLQSNFDTDDQHCISESFTTVLKAWNIKISMDAKGRFKDNIFIERLWRTLKYARIYLRDYETGVEQSRDLAIWFNWYNENRKHSSVKKRRLPDNSESCYL